MPRLVFTQPAFAPLSCALPEGKTFVGQGPANHIILKHDSVSPNHCEILVSWGEVIVRDPGDSLGTWVGEKRVAGQWPLYPGQTVRFGAIEARLEVDHESSGFDTENITHMLRKAALKTDPSPTKDSSHAP